MVLCRHNYALTPCPKNKNCIGCGENTFIKGDLRHLAEARQQHGISALAVTNCHRSIELGEPGVDRWLQKHEEAEGRWRQAVTLLTDPGLEDGTLITLPPPRSSQTKAGLSAAVRGPSRRSGQRARSRGRRLRAVRERLMAHPRLTDADIEKAVRLLDGWTGKLTWDRYLAVLKTEIGHLYTKPGMRKHARVLNAWEMAQRRLNEGAASVGARATGDAAIAEAHRRIATLRAENARLTQENRDLLEQFLRWSHNAARAGLTPELLDAATIGAGNLPGPRLPRKPK